MTKIRLKELCLILLASFFPLAALCADEKIPSQEAAVLSPFLSTLLEHTEAGYVLYDKKPACICGFSENTESFFGPSGYHKLSMSLWGAKKALHPPLFHAKNILLHIDERQGLILVINRRLLLETIQKNLPLFQYVLGPLVTPEALLNAILAPDNTLFSALRYDNVLIGIVLGYGVQNSLFVSREEALFEAFLSQDVPPFSRKIDTCADACKEMLLLLSKNEHYPQSTKDKRLLKPALGFSSLKQEHAELIRKINPSSKRLNNETPWFVFGYVKSDKANQEFIASLEATQTKIQKLLHSPTFLKDVLAMIAGAPIEIESLGVPNLPAPKVNIPMAVAKLINSSRLCEMNSRYHPLFLKGMLETGKELQRPHRIAPFPDLIPVARKNIDTANAFFAALKQDPSFIPISEHLYYKVHKEGTGRPLKNEISVCVDFEVFNPSGKCLSCDSKSRLNLQQTLPSFAHGIQGMRTGELREILIHPALGYGVHTQLEKGIYLKALVTLIDIYDSTGELPALTPLDFSFVYDEESQKEREKDYGNELRLLGKDIGQFLRSCPEIDVAAVVSAIPTLPDNQEPSPEELDALNHIFWDHYFAGKTREAAHHSD